MFRLVNSFLFVLLVATVAFSGVDTRAPLQQLAKDDGVPGPVTINAPGVEPTSLVVTWSFVDSMGNAYGAASSRVKAIAYDPRANALGIIHRGHAGYGSGGQLFYNYDSANGTRWPRVPGGLNAGNPNNSRYPSAALFNPLNSTNVNDLMFSFAAPQLTPSAFGFIIYGVDQYKSGAPFAIEEKADTSYWSNTSIWPASSWVMWTTRRNRDYGYNLWRTQDYSVILSGMPPTWAGSNFSVIGLDIGGTYRNGTSYFGTWAVWPGDNQNVYSVGYSKSTDNGATWGGWTRPGTDWRQVPGIAGSIYDDWWSFGGPGTYAFDMVVDANNRVHFFGVAYDTLTGARALVELFETSTGWDSRFITTALKTNTKLVYGVLNQMGHDIDAAISADGNIISIAWLDGPSVTDTLPDVFGAYRHIGGNWSTPENLTQTPFYAELLLHGAPTLRTNTGGTYTMFLGRTYEARNTSYPPNDATTSFFYAAPWTFGPVAVKDIGGTPTEYALKANYPNPFNPSTMIRFSIPQENFITLKVYDLLGREVANLVSETRKAGNYEVNFDASSLSSGVYFYKLQAGNFVSTQKMTLMK